MEVIILQVIICIFNVYISKTENKRNIYIATFMFNAANLVLYLVTGDKATALSYVLITVRSFIYIGKDKLNYAIIPVGFILLHILVGIESIDKWYQVLSLIAPCITCFYMWFGKTTQHLRIGNIVANTIWLIFNIISGLYIVCINRVVAIISNTIEYIRKRDTNNESVG